MLDRFAKDPSYDCSLSCYEGVLVNDVGGVPVDSVEDATIDRSYWIAHRGIQGDFITCISLLNEHCRTSM